ncbi:MAG: flagellar basal-body rod protein FlgG [Cryobacterium sp.]|nr:flagellar basal-body rod protein FlgG [Oligoflexia bacterium]
MIQTLHTAATALEAQSANLERISNDLANVNTDGFKRGRTEFSELMYKTDREPGTQVGATSQTPVGIQTGLGVKVGASHRIFEQGPSKQTGNPMDMMIEGRGFIPVQRTNGEVAYTRAGAFHRDAQGRMMLANGSQLVPNVVLPANALAITIAPNGEIKAVLPNAEETTLGQIQLATFVNEQGLSSSGDGLYRPTQASGAPIQSIPGEDGVGQVAQGALEASNVNVASSMVEMIQTQRAYEMGTKLLGIADQMLNATVNLK